MWNKIKAELTDSFILSFSFVLFLFVVTPKVWHDEEYALLNMPDILIGALVIFLIMSIASRLLQHNKVVTLGARLFLKSKPRPGFWLSFLGLQIFSSLTLTLLVSLEVTEFSIRELSDAQGIEGALRLFSGIIHINLALLPSAVIQVLETVFLAFLATFLALPAAFIISFLSAKNIMTHPFTKPLYWFMRALFNLIRSIEPLIWALIFTVWVGIGPFAGMLALWIHSIASLAKQYSEIIEDVSEGPIDGVRSTGAGFMQTMTFGVIPQIILPFVSFTIYRWDTNVRMATIIGLVGGGGIGTMLLKYQGQAMWPEVGCIIFVISVAVWLLDAASTFIRESIR